MTTETTYSLTIRSEATKEALGKLAKDLTLESVDHACIDRIFKSLFPTGSITIDPLPSGIKRIKIPKLKSVKEAIREIVKSSKKTRSSLLISPVASTNSVLGLTDRILDRVILLDYWNLSRTYDIYEVERVVKQELFALPCNPEAVQNYIDLRMPLILLTYRKYIHRVTERQI